MVQNQLIIHQNNPYCNTLPEQIKGLMLRIRTTHFETNKQHMTGLSSTSTTHHPSQCAHIQTHSHHAMTMTILINSKTRIVQPSLYRNVKLVWKRRRAADGANQQDIFIFKLSMIQYLLCSSSSQKTLDWMLSNLIQLTKSWVWSVVTGP